MPKHSQHKPIYSQQIQIIANMPQGILNIRQITPKIPQSTQCTYTKISSNAIIAKALSTYSQHIQNDPKHSQSAQKLSQHTLKYSQHTSKYLQYTQEYWWCKGEMRKHFFKCSILWKVAKLAKSGDYNCANIMPYIERVNYLGKLGVLEGSLGVL